MKWLRLYSEVLNDRKVQTLPPELFKTWINLLCLASEHSERGLLPSVPDIAFALRITEPETDAAIAGLIAAGLLENTENGVEIHNWRLRQECPERRKWKGIRAKMTRRVFARDGKICAHCGAVERLTIDHIHPISKGGQHLLENLQVLCHSCNCRKGARV